jgi:rod shape-determining protein MreC
MATFKRKIFSKAILVVSLISPFVLFSSALKPWAMSSSAGLIFQEITYPFELAWDSSITFITETWDHYFDLVDAAEENTKLRTEVAKLGAQMLDYKEQVEEINRLRKLLGFMKRYESNQIMAEIVGSPRQDPFYTIRVAKGRESGVRVGMPIVTAGGVVGRVIRAGMNFSDVQLVVDNNFYLDVLLQRTRVRGVLKGVSGHYCQLQLGRRSEIKIGDTVITSGIVGGFPKGLAVGKVIRISYEADNVTQTVIVEPWIDYQQVEEVVILMTPNREMSKIIDTVGDTWLEKAVKDNERG